MSKEYACSAVGEQMTMFIDGVSDSDFSAKKMDFWKEVGCVF